MNERLCLFFAGYCAYAPSLRFSQLALIEETEQGNIPELVSCMDFFRECVTNDFYECDSRIRTLHNIGNFFEIPVGPAPRNFKDYGVWLCDLIEAFEEYFPMNKIDHYYFLYSRKLTEVRNNIALVARILSQINLRDPSCTTYRKVDKLIKDSDYILFKLIAAAALLSSEHGQIFFNTHYRQLNADFNKFRNLNIAEKSPLEYEMLINDMNSYDSKIHNVLKNCTQALAELGV